MGTGYPFSKTEFRLKVHPHARSQPMLPRDLTRSRGRSEVGLVPLSRMRGRSAATRPWSHSGATLRGLGACPRREMINNPTPTIVKQFQSTHDRQRRGYQQISVWNQGWFPLGRYSTPRNLLTQEMEARPSERPHVCYDTRTPWFSSSPRPECDRRPCVT